MLLILYGKYRKEVFEILRLLAAKALSLRTVWGFLLVYLLSTQGLSSLELRAYAKDDDAKEKIEDVIDEKLENLKLKRTGDVFQSRASWYGAQFHGRTTANSEVFNKETLSAAHKTLPLNTYLLITNLDNNRQLVVRVNDRGPFVEGRDIDVSEAAARELGGIEAGVMKISYEVLREDS
jgi:rare lipoprotein A (peptidoglycan hydrolase)